MSPSHVLLTVQGDLEVQLQCRIKSVLPGEFQLVSDRPLLPNTPAEAELCVGTKLFGEVIGCAPAGPDAYVVSFLFPSRERRSECRFPVDFPGLLMDLTSDGPERKVQVVDISRSGIGFIGPDFLDRGTLIALQTHRCLIYASVRRCTRISAGYRTGVDIDETFLEDLENREIPGLMDKLSAMLARFGRR